MDAEDKRLSFNIGNVNIKQLVILGIVIILIAIFLIFMFKDNKYKKLEESMLATAKNYIKVNNLNVSAEQFLTIKQMGIVNLEGCNEASGVKITLSNNGLKYEPYLICNNYMSKNITTEKGRYIELLGDNPYIVTGNTVFTEPGYKSNGYTVDMVSNYKASPGIYQITYYVYDNGIQKEIVKRTIVVSDISNEEAPILTLNGESNIIVKVGTSYTEPGFSAIDAVDGNITNKVMFSLDNVNTAVIGEYEIVYTVTNSKGIKTTKKRIVSVIDKNLNIFTTASYLPETETNDKVVITIKNNGSSYAYTIKPDGTKTTDVQFDYVVTENNIYTFRIFDKSNNYTEKKVEITNFDRIKPTGNCVATSQGGVVTYNVTASDNSDIKGYSYFNGNAYSEYVYSSTAKYTMNYLGANVLVQDIAGNITKVNCETKLLSTISNVTIPDSATVYVGNNYQIPITLSPTNADKNEIKYEILSGSEYVELSNTGLITGKSAGTATIRLKVPGTDIIRSMTINVKKKNTYVPPSGDYAGHDGTVSEECTNRARTLTAYLNGSEIADYSEITLNVGESVNLAIYLPTECGDIRLLTRTSPDGESVWKNYFLMSANPYVDRYNSNSFVATDHFDWTITGTKKTGRKVMLTLTTFQSTTNFPEIKSFFHVYVKVQ